MAKRATIGENPLDEIVPETHLESVISTGSPRTARPREEPAPETRERLAALEAEIKALKKEISLLRAEMSEMQARMPAQESKWVARLKEKLAGK
jgi:predicted RNase H-like nuclease (RuvC/YqgF family)